ncbi:MAG: acyltransferase family protein [Aureliella sp.]
MSNSRNHIAALTVARGIAAIWVLAHNDGYFRQCSGIDLSTGLLAKGYLAVDFFLLLSGFLIGHLYTDRVVTATPSKAATYFHFVLNRLARIYPLYIFLLLVRVGIESVKYALGVEADFEGPAPFEGANSPGALAANAAMIQAWGFYNQPTWVPSFWSVSAEWFAYLLFPPLIWAAYRFWQTPRLAALTVIGSIVFLAFGIRIHGDVEFPVHYSLLRCVPEFCIGIILAIHWKWIQPRVANASPNAIVVAATMVIVIASHFLWNDLVSVIAAIPLLAGLAAKENARNDKEASRTTSTVARPFIYLGKISYAVYLSHLIVQSGYRIFETKFFGEPTPSLAWLGFGIRLGIVLIGSTALHHMIEVPARNRIRNWLNSIPAFKNPASATQPGQNSDSA